MTRIERWLLDGDTVEHSISPMENHGEVPRDLLRPTYENTFPQISNNS